MENNENYAFVPSLVGALTALFSWLHIEPVFLLQINPDIMYGVKALFSLLMATVGGVLAEIARQEVKKHYNKNKE